MTDEQPTGPPAVESAEISELQARVAELEDQWRRALADFDNLRKRIARESTTQRDTERARVAGQWLPVVANLDPPLEHAADDPSPTLEGGRAGRDHAPGNPARPGLPHGP